ncbi:unnamed protein product [Tilletia controversa]|uniref:Uncharacterized protein n=3 Tax=Tilletia TaxID=13289 RepID=A0A8X7MY96_9BASI|nr:hypothetical protein CF328_g2698 [Tilletia controversa]KAE8262718.1 hypothetical protein A4X03_0g2236 [Tilletia caries]CAD6930757.1 unnamed protein product [Tilletia laevis]KAE8253361.1 hypothetical protein A4X06_0g1507 [Tilletia controversa]CAD6884899.1 unnamed protein product [Tilletia caries]
MSQSSDRQPSSASINAQPSSSAADTSQGKTCPRWTEAQETALITALSLNIGYLNALLHLWCPPPQPQDAYLFLKATDQDVRAALRDLTADAFRTFHACDAKNPKQVRDKLRTMKGQYITERNRETPNSHMDRAYQEVGRYHWWDRYNDMVLDFERRLKQNAFFCKKEEACENDNGTAARQRAEFDRLQPQAGHGGEDDQNCQVDGDRTGHFGNKGKGRCYGDMSAGSSTALACTSATSPAAAAVASSSTALAVARPSTALVLSSNTSPAVAAEPMDLDVGSLGPAGGALGIKPTEYDVVSSSNNRQLILANDAISAASSSTTLVLHQEGGNQQRKVRSSCHPTLTEDKDLLRTRIIEEHRTKRLALKLEAKNKVLDRLLTFMGSSGTSEGSSGTPENSQ